MSSKRLREQLKKQLIAALEAEMPDWEREAMKMPHMDEWVEHPATGVKAPLWIIITNLNDHCKWSRDKIADWLDRLNDEGLDLSFRVKGDEYDKD